MLANLCRYLGGQDFHFGTEVAVKNVRKALKFEA